MSRAAFTAPTVDFFLAIAAFNSSSARANLDAGGLHQTLESLLAGHEHKARAAGLDWSLYTESKYALVALADDLALHSDWDHAESWNRYLLELRHFNTSFAGQEFFDRLEQLKQRLSTTHEPALREQLMGALEIYFTCLKLGFRGRFRGQQSGQVDQIENGLLNILWPHGAAGARSRAWPDAYAASGAGQIANRVRLWWWPIPLTVLLAVGVWFYYSQSLKTLVDERIEDASEMQDKGASATDHEDEDQ